MTSFLLMFLLSVFRALTVSPVPSCPASCVVCSNDAIICHRLAHIIVAPDTTQALLLTEGSISTVQSLSLSDLSNITVIGLSHNQISVLSDQSFRKLPILHTLLLDHNLLTSQALQDGALTNLTQLEVLALGHNLISMIQGGWFKGNRALRSLKLEGNLLTSVVTGSFPEDDLAELESLDLSDNLIYHLDRNSFGGLVSLHTLDLSRNRLSSAPVEAFSYLSWLTNLNLDLNTWNCSCQLLELASLLYNFMQQPDKMLFNGRRMVCVNADNPAVTTVLELTEANCVLSNQNITVQVEMRGGVMPQLYTRDLAITAVTCFIGGVGLALLVVLIFYQAHQRRKLRESKRQKVEEERSSTAANHQVNHLDAYQKRGDIILHANSSKPWESESMMLDMRSDGHGGQLKSRDEGSSHLRCPGCKEQRGAELNSRWNKRIDGEMEPYEERERMMTKEEARQFGNAQDTLRRNIPSKSLSHSNTNSSSHPQRETFSQRAEGLREMEESLRTDMSGRSRRLNETFHCESCHRTYRPAEQNTKQGRNHTNMRDSVVFERVHAQYRQNDRFRNINHNQFDVMRSPVSRRKVRNVTFDLERGHSQDRGKHDAEGEESLREERGRVRRHKVQSGKLLRVKLNLNPLRKSKVHPRRKSEQSDTENSHLKRTKDRRYNGKERRDRKEAKGGKNNKSLKAEGSLEDGEESKEDKGTKGKKSKKRDPSTKGKGTDESRGVEQKKDSPPANSDHEPGSSTSAAQAQSLQTGGIQYQGAGFVLGGAQHVLSLSATDRNQTTNLPLLGPAGSQLFGSSLSLQGGNPLAPRSATLFPSSLAAPSTTICGPGKTSAVVQDGFIRQAGAGFIAPATSLQVNTGHENPLQSGAIHPSSLQSSQSVGLASNLTANPAVVPAPMQSYLQGNLPVVSSPLVAAQGPGLQTNKGAPQSKESHILPTQVTPNMEGLSGVTPQTPGPVTTVEDLSNSKSQIEMAHVPAEGLFLNEGLTAGDTGGGMQAADVPALSLSTQSVSSTGDAGMSPALLQQEYLSEEGGSSPRRKLRLILPEKTSSRPPTALERKIR
ncbi:uncharacterized protein lrrc53 [Xyrichtys novacula]|uniref:Uncharacterized protein lrrc53 n=1 Tax=Xyrichtys novacula TaxID=13765 RepID=A0AAV1GGV4_XYRNO|nr:uncharacterized protein lrrc53 [Xyrichtys novacula]